MKEYFKIRTGLEFVSLEYISDEHIKIIKSKIKEIESITKSADEETVVISIYLHSQYENENDLLKIEKVIITEFSDWLIPRRSYHDLNQQQGF